MMERRRALTIPFTVDKDNLLENPLRLPMKRLSSECGKLESQVSWTAFTECKIRQQNSWHKNGSVTLNHSHAAMNMLEMDRRKPLLILTDVLKTEHGKAYVERIKRGHTMSNREPMTMQRDSGRCREEPLTCRDTRSSQRETRNNRSKRVTPKHNQQTTPTSSQRLKLRRKLQNSNDEEDEEENKDIKEVVIGKDSEDDDKFAEVVDCGLSVSWEPTEDTASCDEFSPASIKDRWTDPEKDVQHSLKRKRKGSGSHCNGTASPKRHRENVFGLTGEDGIDEGPALTRICHEDSGEDGDLDSLDRCIVQFTVGEEDGTDILLPVIGTTLEGGDFISSPTQNSSSTQENTTQTSPSEPIVLSSDDEENGAASQRCSPAVLTLATVEDTVMQGLSSEEAVAEQQEASDIQDMQVLQVFVEDDSCSVTASPIPSMDYPCAGVAFSTLHCGGYQGKASGSIMIAKQDVIIPLKDTSEQLEVMLTFDRKDLKRYSVWEQQEMEARELQFESEEEPFPATVLLFCVSETAAAAVQRDLSQLGVKQDGATNTGKASPFILLTLRDPLEGIEGAFLRSVLDIDCLNSLANEQAIVPRDAGRGLEDFLSPVLSLDDSIELIRRTGLDSHLLSMLGVTSTDLGLNVEEDNSHSDTNKSPTPDNQLEVNSLKESVLEPETAPEGDTGSQLTPKEDQKEQEPEDPSDPLRLTLCPLRRVLTPKVKTLVNDIRFLLQKGKEEPTPVYTLCHHRTKGSYSVSLCKPDSSWTKYKHQGLASRLIQFPPPPLKGGITVTMEDLQCLDSGQFLNDVIIDFYLKYLLQNASAAVAERSHIFSSFFFKQLTRRDNASEGGNSDSCQRQRRHQRVKTWTRHVDIFKKDFLFVPVNQEAHWYLVVICFPGLDEPKLESWTGSNLETGKSHSGKGESQGEDESQGCQSSNDNVETASTSHRSDSVDTQTESAPEESTKDPPPGPVNCTELTCQKKTVCKRPCILIMDSLKLSLHERVFKLLREYLQSEWEVRRGSSRDFGPDQMKNSHCQVPLQDNSSDCGLYLLQYVECFLKDPVVHFELPLCLARWFPRQQVRRKRDEIRDLILNLYRHQNLDNRRMKQLSC